MSWRHFAGLIALGAVSVTFVLIAAPAVGVTVLKPYQTERLRLSSIRRRIPARRATIEPVAGRNRRRRQDGSRRWLDPGPLSFLPEQRTDFPFAAIAERWGFAGAGFVLSLYALLVWRGLRILTVAKNLYGALIAGGIVAMLLFQVFINVGMNVGIMPITGIPLPLLSYGGSSVITTLLAIGLLQSIYAQGRNVAAAKGRGRSF